MALSCLCGAKTCPEAQKSCLHRLADDRDKTGPRNMGLRMGSLRAVEFDWFGGIFFTGF